MADKRMFSKQIIDSDKFLSLSFTSQALYFHLVMRADDDGFIDNPNKILRVIGASWNDILSLAEREYIILFRKEIIVIKHWKLHNSIKQDRYKPTIYQKEKSYLTEKNKEYFIIDIDLWDRDNADIPSIYGDFRSGIRMEPEWNQNGTDLAPQNREDKDRSDKDILGSRVVNSINNNYIGQTADSEGETAAMPERNIGTSCEGKETVPASIMPEDKSEDESKATGRAFVSAEKADSVSGSGGTGEASAMPEDKSEDESKATGRAFVSAEKAAAIHGKNKTEATEIIAPTLEELKRYANLKSLNVDAEKFFEYYSALGWRTAKGKPLNWRLKMRDWHKSERSFGKSGNPFLALIKEGGRYDG